VSERKPAPGRVLQGLPGEWWGCCDVPDCETVQSDGDILSVESAAAAGDSLREHLRTEHADLWEACVACDGFKQMAWPGPEGVTYVACPDCHGRGYIETERSA
jgi:ssDNA-binding Zn-finger/Zn-ribbon topoisomerase 1